MDKPLISIVGAGLGGLACANRLLSLGWPTSRLCIYERWRYNESERCNTHRRHQYAIALQSSTTQSLARFPDVEIRPSDCEVGGHGRVDGAPGSMRVHRDKLENRLRANLKSHNVSVTHSHEFKGMVAGSKQTTLSFGPQNDEPVPDANANIVIAFDGVHSTVRKTILSQYHDGRHKCNPVPLPYVVIFGRRSIPKPVFDASVKPLLGDSAMVRFPVPGQKNVILQISLDHVSANEPQSSYDISWMYSRPAKTALGTSDALYKPDRSLAEASEMTPEIYAELDTALRLLCEHPAPAQIIHSHHRPVDLDSDPASVSASTSTSVRAYGPIDSSTHGHGLSQLFSSEVLRTTKLISFLMRTTQVDLRILKSAASNGIYLAGDAAHAEPILGGFGGDNAINDGITIAEQIVRDCSTAGMTSWYDDRYPQWTAGVERSVQELAAMHAQQP